MDRYTESLLERANIEDNKQFSRLAEKTQVLSPQTGMDEVAKNRATHSYEVATSANMMTAFVAGELNISPADIDYMHSIHNASLLHDIGHPPFGHDGADLIDKFVKKNGSPEGFSDNNNNLVVIRKNNIVVSDYTLVSTIKYPNNLYNYQKTIYHPLLKLAIDSDLDHFSNLGIGLTQQSTTIACQIMDEADRNSYTCSDLADFISIGNKINVAQMIGIVNKTVLSKSNLLEANKLIALSNDSNKNDIKSFFSNLKKKFNANYKLTNMGIDVIDQELLALREFLNKVSFELYIRPIRKQKVHAENMNKLLSYINYVYESNHFPSTYYEQKFKDSSSSVERIEIIRDMVGEVSDWYIINSYEKLNLKNRQIPSLVNI
jgi:dGTP triphosphohydrolase